MYAWGGFTFCILKANMNSTEKHGTLLPAAICFQEGGTGLQIMHIEKSNELRMPYWF